MLTKVRLCVLILTLFVSMSFAQTTNQIIVAKAGEPVLFDKLGTSYLMTESEYKEIRARFAANANFISVKIKPKNLSSAARFRFNLVINHKNIGWILDGDEARGFTLYADWNANGDLTDDAPLKFKKTDGVFSNSYKTTLTETVGNKRRKYPYLYENGDCKNRPARKDRRRICVEKFRRYDTARKIQYQQSSNNFRIDRLGGIYNNNSNKLYFDLNGDGSLDTETRYSTEAFKVSERYVNINDKTYEFSVDRYGDSLTLNPLAEKMPDRADLSPGSVAPDIAFKDLARNSHRLTDFRGHIVLLDFWGLWCAPCVAEAPKLAAAYKKLKDRGFEIVSFDTGDTVDNLQKFTDEMQMNWTHSQADDALIKMYQIDHYPSYFLLDQNGRIISNTLRPGEELYKKVEEMLENQSRVINITSGF